MFYVTVKNSLLSSLQRLKETLFLAEEKVLESIPEPYVPLVQDIADIPEKLSEKTAKVLHGSDANATQLGDPVSLKAEQSDLVSNPDEHGARAPRQPSPGSVKHTAGGSSGSSSSGPGKLDNGAQGESLTEKAMKGLHESAAKPSMVGDHISLEDEQIDHTPTTEEEGTKRRESKL